MLNVNRASLPARIRLAWHVLRAPASFAVLLGNDGLYVGSTENLKCSQVAEMAYRLGDSLVDVMHDEWLSEKTSAK